MKNNLLKVVNEPDIGSIYFERSSRAKRISISIKSTSKIRVAVPSNIPLEYAIEFTNTKKTWIKNKLHQLDHQIRKHKHLTSQDIHSGKQFLIDRLEILAEKNNFIYSKVVIRNQKTRWGSCSATNSISLNIQLINLPDYLIDYVIFHELVHTIVKNHSVNFWKTLSKFVPNAKAVDKDLKKYYLY